MNAPLSVEDKSELREVLKKLGSLPESSQESVKSGVLKLLENEEKKVEKLVSLKKSLEQEGFIKGDVILTKKIYGLDYDERQKVTRKLGTYYRKNYKDNANEEEYDNYEYGLMLIQEHFENLEFDEKILTKNDKKDHAKKIQMNQLYKRLIEEGIINDNNFTYEDLQNFSKNGTRATKEVLQYFSDTHLGNQKYISALKYILKNEGVVVETNTFNKGFHKGKEIQTKVTQTLKSYSAKRLILSNNRQIIPLDEVSKYESDSGVLCVLENSEYKKINIKKHLSCIKERHTNGIDIGTEEIIKRYGIQGIKLSDLGHLKTHPKGLSSKNKIPSNNSIDIIVPNEFIFNSTTYKRNKFTSRTLIVNNNTVILYDQGYSFVIDTSNTTGEKQVLGTQGFHDRATEYNPIDYIKQKKGEGQGDYFKRLMRFSSFEFLPAVYNDLLDNAYFELQNFSLEEQMSFGIYYSSLDEKQKNIIKNLLKQYGEDIFNVFKICEDSIGNGNLIMDIYNKYGKTNSVQIFEKIVGIIDILKNLEKVKEHGGNDTNLYLEVMNKALSTINKVLQEEGQNGIESILENIQDDLLEEGLIFKNIMNKGIQGLDDLDKAAISMVKLKSEELNTESKVQIKEKLMSLYKDNYSIDEEANFIGEIEKGIDTMLNDEKNTDIYTFEVKGKTILSCYVSNIDDENVYIGGLNANENFKDYSFGFWVLEKILDEHENKNRHAKVFTAVEGKEKRNGSILLRKYKSMGTDIGKEGISPESNFTNIKWKKDNNT